jgi:two-component system chemotaxis response regulator CheY
MAAIDKRFIRNAQSLSGLRFLVVDDHKFSRKIVIESLKWLDATNVTEAEDGAEALQLLRGTETPDREVDDTGGTAKHLDLTDDRVRAQNSFDCVVTDFNMQNSSGLDLLKAIRTGKARCPREFPVLMLTGFSDDSLIAAALHLDVNAFILKPIARTVFSEKLNKVLMRPIEAQPVDAYETVQIAHVDEVRKQDPQNPETETGEPAAETPETSSNVVQMDIPDIPDGSILWSNIEGPNGAVMVHHGTQLTSILLEKLWELHKMGWIELSLPVQAPPERKPKRQSA